LETSQLMAELVDADYHLKSLVFGKLPVQGVTPVQQEAARLAVNAPVAQTTARFWYSPRPVEPGDVAVNRSAAADVIRFDTEPQLLTEVLRAEGPGARETGSAIESAAQQVSTQVTRALPGLEQLHPELRLKQLRQAFEISLAASILRLQSLPPPCKTLLNSVTQITLTPATFRTDFPVDRYKSPVLGTPREIVIWGGVEASVNLAAADLETDAALAALAPARTRGRWDGYSRRLAVGFEPEIVSERPLTGAQMARPHLMRADQLLRKRDLKGALESAKAALSLDAGAGEARRIRCEAFLRANRPEEMLAEASAWVKQSPQLSRAYFWRGVAYGELYRTPESLADAERAIRLAPRDWLPLTLRADAKKRSSDNAGAVADLTEALKLAPDSSFIYLERGYAWEAAKEKEKAVADFSQALAFNPTSARALYERASLYRDLEKPELALKDCERLFQVQPTAANLGFLASLRLLLNDAEGAVRDATQALTLERYRYQSYVLRSNAYRKLKRYDEALEDLRFGLGIVRDTGRDQYMIPILEQLEKELLELRKG
jgi:tetratricopeptide (TPR) repeat protein